MKLLINDHVFDEYEIKSIQVRGINLDPEFIPEYYVLEIAFKNINMPWVKYFETKEEAQSLYDEITKDMKKLPASDTKTHI
jgi:hypothetical protein